MARSRRVILATGGSLGDLHPVIAVGRALRREGLEAIVAAALDYRAKIEAEGLEFREVGPSLARLEQDTGLNLAQLTAKIARSDRFLFEDIMLAYAAESAGQMIAAAADADVICGLSFAPGARMAAETLKRPFVSIALQPTTVFSVYDPPFLPNAPWLAPASRGLGLWRNRATLALARLTTAGWTHRLNGIRRNLGLGPAPGDVVFDALKEADLSLGLYSPLLGEGQPDAPTHFHVVGHAAYDSETGGASDLSPELSNFLDAGPPPVVFTLGSAAVNIPGDFYWQGAKAARSMRRRAVFLVGPDGDLSVADGPDLMAVRYAPFSKLFPRAAAVVHQGGVGTVQQALRAGRPQVVVPHLGDQHDNGARVVRLGCGVSLKRNGLSADRLIGALDRILAPETVARAVAVGELARDEDGAARAAERIAAIRAGDLGSARSRDMPEQGLTGRRRDHRA